MATGPTYADTPASDGVAELEAFDFASSRLTEPAGPRKTSRADNDWVTEIRRSSVKLRTVQNSSGRCPQN